ncbi:hypothetical protein [Rugamonas rivuli]|uniref:Uncharacterized protein n=1 Tax=Rugamonas rivuli TaxID=2743358 RepID=A0A843SH96_9BURK|nr:hypothetical protein [Rugamonas rivuli]MQA21521.1 hypothetical protein [Rugamonas rivuli]
MADKITEIDEGRTDPTSMFQTREDMAAFINRMNLDTVQKYGFSTDYGKCKQQPVREVQKIAQRFLKQESVASVRGSSDPCARANATNVVDERCAIARYVGSVDWVGYDDVDADGFVVRTRGTQRDAEIVGRDKRKQAIIDRARKAEAEFHEEYYGLPPQPCPFRGPDSLRSPECIATDNKVKEIQKRLMAKFNVKLWVVK